MLISDLTNHFREVEPLVPLINQHGEQLFMAVIRCVGGAASRSYIDYFTDVLLALNKKYFDNLCRQVVDLTIHISSLLIFEQIHEHNGVN